MAREKSLTRRELLRSVGAAALLAACSDPLPMRSASGADAAGTADGAAASDAQEGHFVPHSTGPIPAVTPNAQHYVTTFSASPPVDSATWTLTFLDRGTQVGQINLAWLAAHTAREKEHTLECISAGTGNPAISNAIWTGLPLREIFMKLGIEVPAETKWLKGTAADNYTTAIPLADLDRPVWLVWLMNGEPLPSAHGFPVRMLTPGRYGMKGPKWLTQLEFIDKSYLGLWEKMGWSDDATYRPNTMIRTLESGGTIAAGLHQVAGTAFAGSDPVVKVEVRVDGGVWQDAVLDYAPGADVWALWHYDWLATKGEHLVQARCTTKSGATSAETSYGDGGKALIGYNGSMAVTIAVT